MIFYSISAKHKPTKIKLPPVKNIYINRYKFSVCDGGAGLDKEKNSKNFLVYFTLFLSYGLFILFTYISIML